MKIQLIDVQTKYRSLFRGTNRSLQEKKYHKKYLFLPWSRCSRKKIILYSMYSFVREKRSNYLDETMK